MNVRVKFYLDEHVNPSVAKGLRRRDIAVLTTQEAEMLGASDEEHLALATSQNYVVFTQDDDFIRLHTKGVEHAGIVYVHQRTSIGYIVRGLMLIYQVLSPAEMKNRLEFL